MALTESKRMNARQLFHYYEHEKVNCSLAEGKEGKNA